MDKGFKYILKLTWIYIGLIVGAGFASGREIMTFFTSYGSIWPLGIVLTGILFSILGYLIMDIIEKYKVKTYSEFLKIILPEKLGVIMEVVSGIFLFVLFFSMVAAFGSVFYEAFGIKRLKASSILAILSFIVFVFGFKGIIRVNEILSPIMVFGTIIVCTYAIITRDSKVFALFDKIDLSAYFIFFSAFIYVSYNIITSISIFVEAKDILERYPEAKVSGILGGIGLGGVGLLLGAVLGFDWVSYSFDIPMLEKISELNIYIRYLYVLVLIGAIITTAVANGFGCIKWASDKIYISRNVMGGVICILSVLFSYYGFSRFTDKIYPFFGYLGLFEIFYIFKFSIFKNR